MNKDNINNLENKFASVYNTSKGENITKAVDILKIILSDEYDKYKWEIVDMLLHDSEFTLDIIGYYEYSKPSGNHHKRLGAIKSTIIHDIRNMLTEVKYNETDRLFVPRVSGYRKYILSNPVIFRELPTIGFVNIHQNTLDEGVMLTYNQWKEQLIEYKKSIHWIGNDGVKYVIFSKYVVFDEDGNVDTIQQVKQFEDKRIEYYNYILENKPELLEVKSREFGITKV